MAVKDYSKIVTNARKKKDEKSSSSSFVKSKDYSSVVEGQILSKSINLDSLDTDIKTVAKTIDKAYNGWQTKETMKNALSSVQKLYDRIGKYQEYQKKYGGTDLSDLQNAYKGVIDDWDNLSKQYSKYKSAEAYNKSVKEAKAQSKAMKTADIGAVKTEIADLEGILKTAKDKESNINRLRVKQNAWEHRSRGLSTDKGYAGKVEQAENELREYLNNVGYSGIGDIEKALGEKKVFKTNAERFQNKNKLSSVGDVNSENYDKDYDKYIKFGKSVPVNEVGTSTRKNPVGKGRLANTPVENDNLREAILAAERRANGKTSKTANKHYDKGAIFDFMTDDEVNNLYYYIGKDKENGGNRANEFLDSIMDSLNARRGEEISRMVKDTPFGEGAFSIEAGLDQWSEGIKANFSKKDYIPTSPIQYASGIVREDIEYEHGNFARTMYDLAVTGANQLPSIAVSTMLGAIAPPLAAGSTASKVVSNISKGAGLAAMGASARGNAYQEMLNLGYDKNQANTYANLIGASETGLQAMLGGISKLGGTSAKIEKLVSQIDNGIARFAIQFPLAMASEATEEGLQEILNPLFTNIAAGYDTGAEIDWGEVAYSALLGGLMGGMFEGPGLTINSIAENSYNKAMGQNIKANERVGDLFDIASNPEMASAYETYTRYAKKGINADNIPDSKLGRLYSMTATEAQKILESKASSEEQRNAARKTLENLEVYAQYNFESRASNNDIKSKYDSETVDALIDEGLKSDENTTSYKLAAEYKAKIESGKKLSTDEISKLVKANEQAFKTEGTNSISERLTELGEDGNVSKIADIISRKVSGEVITEAEFQTLKDSKYGNQVLLENTNEEIVALSKSMTEENAELFLRLYDGKTDVDAYANAFNLVSEYAKNPYSYNEEYVLANKSVLSDEQAIEIYRNVIIAEDKAEKEAFNKLIEKMRSTMHTKGYIDDSAIDYQNTSAERKVNWKDLNSRQRQAITYLKGLFKGLGGNLTFVGKNKKFNGWYSIEGDTVFVDVYAGMDVVSGLGIDSIIPTASHELTHEMEVKSPETFKKVADIVLDVLAESKKTTRETIIADELARLYNKRPDSKHTEKEAISELVARACEDMLSVSEEGKKIFNSLSETEQKTLVERIKELLTRITDWINELLSSYKSKSQEAKALRDVKEAFDEVSKKWDMMLAEIRDNNKALEKSGVYKHENTIDEGVLFQTRSINGNEVVWIEENILKENKGQPVHQFIADFISEHIGDVYTLIESGQKVYIGEDLSGEYTQSKYTQKALERNPNIIKAKNKATANIKEIIEIATNRRWEKTKHKENKDAKYGMYSYDTRFGFPIKNSKGNVVSANIYKAELIIRNASDGRKYLYDIVNIKKDAVSSDWMSKKISSAADFSAGQKNNVSTDSIRNSERNVNTKFSDRDSTGRELSKGQMEYFKDSVVRDDNGNLLAMYHGTPNAGFTKFRPGTYFTENRLYADVYQNQGASSLGYKKTADNPDTYSVYLNIKKPFDTRNKAERDIFYNEYYQQWGMGTDLMESGLPDWLDGADLQEFIEEKGYDYDGLILDEGGVGGYGDEVISRGLAYVTFKPEQVKDIDNLNPTENEDYRFSMRKTVEETKDLVAVHNLSPEKLLKTLKLGGLPMPSIAITRARDGYNNFGSISLVFGKDTIDPQFMRSNKIYSGDAWTPTYPQIEYKLNTKAQEKIKKKIDALVPSNVQSDLGGTHLDSFNMEDELNRHGDMVTSYRYNSAMKYAFLKDNNVDIELPTKEEPLYRYGEVSNNTVISFANKLVEGLKTANSLYEQHSSKLMADEELLNSIAMVLNEEAMSSVEKDSEAYQKLVENPIYKPEDIDLSTVLGMLEASRKYFRTNGKIEQKVDYREARTLIDEKTDMAQYESWLKDLFSDVVAKEGIRNNKDLYTPSGNRRNFEALHYEHTLENVIKAMKEEGSKGIGGFGGGNLFGASTTEYTSIDDVKTDAENRMQNLPESKYDEIKKGFNDRFFELANSLPIHKDSFSAIDDAANMLIEAVLKFKTKSGMANYLRTESKGWANYSDYIVDDLVELVNDIRNMPVAYFEAKPQRAVGYDEIKAVIMPEQTSYEDDLSEIKSELEKLGVPILEYEYGDNNARIKALNSLEEVMFSDRDTATNGNTFIDIEGKERNILKHGELGYHVLGTRKYNSYFSSIQEAIDAENDNIKSHYAKKLSVKRSYIDKMLKNDDQFLVRLSSGDISFSERDDNVSVYDLMGEKESLIKENEKFRADVERLKERLKIEKQVTHGNYFNENQLGTVAGHLRNISKSNIDKVELMKSLKDVYSFIAQSENLAWEDVFERCYNVADAILAEAKPVKISDDYSKYLLKDIRNTRISLDETQKKEAQYHFGKNWNRYFMGKVIIANDGINIDSKWQEWSNMYPEIFNADTNSIDMIGELYDIIDSLKAASETIDEYGTEEHKRWLAREIYNQYWNVSTIRTTADKYDKQIKRLNFEHRQAMAEMRDNYNTKLKEQHRADKEKQKKLIAEIRERKDKEIAVAKEHGKQRLELYKENAERKTRIQSITANSLSLNEMLVKNSKDKHIPEAMKGPVALLIQAIDFSSKRMLEKGEPTRKDISLSRALSRVNDMMVKLTSTREELVDLYGHGLDEKIEKLIKSVDNIVSTVGDNEYVLNRMTLTELKTLDTIVKTIKHAVNDLNKFHVVNHARGIANLSQESISYLDSLGKGKIYDGIRGKTNKLLNWGNAIPYYVFKRFGSGGIKVFEALQDGWDKFAFNIKKIIDYANETYTSKEVNEWSEDVKTFKIVVPANEYELADENYEPQYQEVQLTVSQIMSMYCLNKREQARGHLFKGGIRVADFKNKKGKIISQPSGIIFTENEMQTILNSLTDRQKAVADKLQDFMNTVCANWGNDVSMERFGYKAFGEENYFPIQSDKNNLAVNDETEQPNSLFKLLNMSFTKSTMQNANNRIVISDIFDVFAQHTSDMAKYNALALPVLDSFKWYNYTEKQDAAEGTFKTIGVKQSIERAFGRDGQNYFTTFLKDINGQQDVSRDTLGNGFFKKAKIAAVGANLRVILLQPTSYVRASAVIDNKYLTKALLHQPKIKKAETYCGIALWKAMGYYDTNIQKGVTAQIKHADTWKDKATEGAMKGAEIADKITWGYLWNACELEVRDKRTDLKVGSQEFYDAIAKRLREVIYATQVVDSTMTRSQMMRSNDGYDKLLTAFASEPTLSYNMLQDSYIQYQLDARSIGKVKAAKKNAGRISRIVYAYTMTTAVAALVESAFDYLRDDDDEEMDVAAFMKFYLSNFAEDMSIGNKLPYIKELYSLIKGFSSSRTDTQWMETMIKAIKSWYKFIDEGKGTPSKLIKDSTKAMSDLIGFPFYNLFRDAMATLNKIDLFTYEDLNEMFGDLYE